MQGREKLLQEALKAAEKANYNGIFLLPTGSGKGKLMIEIAKRLKPKRILYLCNTTLLRDKMFVDELHKWDAGYLIPNIDMQCYQTACKWEGKEYDLLLADEFDAALTPAYIKAITNNKFKNKILVSATLDDSKKRKAKKIAPIVFEKVYKDLIDDKVLNKMQGYYVYYNLTPDENATYLWYNTRFKELLNSVQNQGTKAKLEMLKISRKQFLSKLQSSLEVTKWLISNIKKTNQKILIFTGLSEQANRISKNSYHNKNDDEQLLEDFNSGKITVLVVVNKVDRGLNIDDVRNIVHESIGSSKTRMVQRTGRGMRLEHTETLNIFFLIPQFITTFGVRKPTIVQKWVEDSTVDMDLTGAKIIMYEQKK